MLEAMFVIVYEKMRKLQSHSSDHLLGHYDTYCYMRLLLYTCQNKTASQPNT